MDLTDSEREEFNRLANDTLDPELWTEDDLPALRRARAQYEREDARGSDTPPTEPPDIAEGNEGSPQIPMMPMWNVQLQHLTHKFTPIRPRASHEGLSGHTDEQFMDFQNHVLRGQIDAVTRTQSSTSERFALGTGKIDALKQKSAALRVHKNGDWQLIFLEKTKK